MNEAQGPNKTVPQDPPSPQAATQVHQVHQGPQAVVRKVMSTTFSLGPGWSTTVLDFSDAVAVKLYNKVILPLELKFDGEADNLAVFLTSVKDHCNHFNGSNLITIPLADTTTKICSPTMRKLLSATALTMGSLMSPPRQEMHKTMTCSTISWLTLWNPSSGPRFFYMLKVTPPTMLWLPLLFSSRSLTENAAQHTFKAPC